MPEFAKFSRKIPDSAAGMAKSRKCRPFQTLVAVDLQVTRDDDAVMGTLEAMMPSEVRLEKKITLWYGAVHLCCGCRFTGH